MATKCVNHFFKAKLNLQPPQKIYIHTIPFTIPSKSPQKPNPPKKPNPKPISINFETKRKTNEPNTLEYLFSIL